MSSQKRTASRASTAKSKIEKHELKSAYIVPAEMGDKMVQALAELPIKYSQLVGPIIDGLQKAYRGDIDVMVDPSKAAPTPTPKPTPEPKAKMQVEKPVPK